MAKKTQKHRPEATFIHYLSGQHIGHVIDERINTLAYATDLDNARINAEFFALHGFWFDSKTLIAPGAILAVRVVLAVD